MKKLITSVAACALIAVALTGCVSNGAEHDSSGSSTSNNTGSTSGSGSLSGSNSTGSAGTSSNDPNPGSTS